MRSRRSDRSRQRLRTLITIIATALVIAPAAALATHSFTDVNDGDFFHAAVDWMKDNGVTVGCNPPNNTRYCPHNPVTRGEMAVFLERLDSKNVFLRPGEATDGDGGDADTLDGIDSKDFATDAEVAGLDAFVPVATISVTNGAIDHVNFRDPVTSMPTISGADGQFTIDLPGFAFASNDDDMAVCSGRIRNLNVSVDSSGGDLRVDLYESDGTLADSAFSEDDFGCVVYAGT